MNHNKKFRILAVSLSTEGFGYALTEEDSTLVDYGNKVFPKEKNAHSLTEIDKLIALFQPNVLVLHNVDGKGTYRALRIKELHRDVVMMAEQHKLKVTQISNSELRTMLLDDPRGTKHAMAVRVARQFPDDLASRVPPKRKPWTSQQSRMDIFDAVGLAVVFRLKAARRGR